ncbi:MAG: hypothetical protein ACXU82_07335 [Caulobacteraceae bacterium]
MKDFVARENIVHFRALLAQDLSVERRSVIEDLLAAEEAKLANPSCGTEPFGRPSEPTGHLDAGPD